MGLLDKRLTYAPFEYQKAFDVWQTQQQMHWLHSEVSMAADIDDWKSKLTEAEKAVIGGVLKGFVNAEILIEDYWTQVVANRIKKPEVQMAASTIAAMESIHAVAYAYLNESLGLMDFDAFLHEPAAKAKIERLMEVKSKTKTDLARSLAIFSAFNEGVNLFSAFAILMSFSRRNLLKGVGQIVAFSSRDESLHSEFGCYLFRQLVEEYPEIWTDELKKDIYDAARLTVQLEDDFIDQCFKVGKIEGIDASDLKQYIRHRANTKLGDLGLKSNWKNVDKQAVERITSWYDAMVSGVEKADFFAGRVTTYMKGRNFDEMWRGDWH